MTIPKRQTELDAFVRARFPDKPRLQDTQNGHRASYASLSRSDEEIIEKVRREQGGKFDRLWRGDTSVKGGDHSACDDSFCHKLYPYTQDEEQIRRIHASSGLHRPDKSGNRVDYLERSLKRARENTTWFHKWPEQSSTHNPELQDEVHSRSRSLSSTGMRNYDSRASLLLTRILERTLP
jgi:primase-polymerase (primpol)-like protein